MLAALRPCSLTLMLVAGLYGAATGSASSGEPSAADIAKLVDAANKAKPDWWDQTTLNYPKTLDLTCPKGGKWNNSVVPGQWTWDIVNPNQGRWKEGAKFWHLVLTNAKDNKLTDAETQAIGALGHCYGDLLQDWPRALYWYQQAEAASGPNIQRTIDIANAYLHLGSKTLAVKTLKTLRQDTTEHGSLIKMWADLGDYQTAYKLASQRVGSSEDIAYLLSGYTAQLEGDWKKALDFFTKAEAANQKNCGRTWKQSRERAKAAIEGITLFESLDLAKVADGTYKDVSTGYTGPLEVSVTVANKKITAVKVTNHKEKQYYSSIDEIPAKIIAKQHVKGVDGTVGATITAEAITYATAKALNQGLK